MREYTYNELRVKRAAYSNVEWLSSKGVYTKIIEIDNDYLTNILAKVHNKCLLAAAYPLVDSFQQWNNISYSVWADIIYAELQYRDACQEKHHLEMQWHEELAKESQYDRYDTVEWKF